MVTRELRDILSVLNRKPTDADIVDRRYRYSGILATFIKPQDDPGFGWLKFSGEDHGVEYLIKFNTCSELLAADEAMHRLYAEPEWLSGAVRAMRGAEPPRNSVSSERLRDRISEIADDCLGLQPTDADPIALLDELEKTWHEHRIARLNAEAEVKLLRAERGLEAADE